MRFLYFGDGLWATRCLERLLKDGHECLGVVLRTKPTCSSLRKLAERLSIPIHVPPRVNEEGFVVLVKSLNPDLNISMSYDQIMKSPILDSTPYGFINCHAGKLPFYRGRNVVNWAIINGEAEIGLTIHYIDEGIDTGDIIFQEMIPINWEDTYGTVLEKLEGTFPPLLADSVSAIGQGAAPRIPQNVQTGSYCVRRKEGDEWIDWHSSSLNIYNKIRGITHPGPGATTLYERQKLLIWEAIYDPEWAQSAGVPGTILANEQGGVRIQTGDSTILVKDINREPDENVVLAKPDLPVGGRFYGGSNLHNVSTPSPLLRSRINSAN